MQDCRCRKRDAGESESQEPTRTSTTKQIRVGEEDSDQSTPDTASPTSDNSPQPTTSTPAPSPAKTPVHTNADTPVQLPADLLFSDSEEEDGVKQIRVTDSGSHSQLARVDVQGVPADGIVDTAADITIMGGKLFALVAATAKLRKRNFRKPDTIPKNYDRREFCLDGCMEMDITFQDKTMKTTVYIKMDAFDQLLLSEGVCRQLGIVAYHPSLVTEKAPRHKETTLVPSIRVSLVQSMKLPPSQCRSCKTRILSRRRRPDSPYRR